MDWFENEDFWREFYPCMFPPERFAAAGDDVNRIVELTGCNGGSVLDLCCGPGRHAVEFARRGFQVTGVDRSAFLLERAHTHAREEKVSVEWVQEDMRSFVRPAGFDLVCNMFTSFGYFEDEQDDMRALRNIHANLKPGGTAVLEMLGKERLARTWQSSVTAQLPDGSLWLQRTQVLDGWTRIRPEWTLIKEGRAKTVTFEYTIYSGRELKDRMLSCGFSTVKIYGDLQSAPYGLDALRLVAVGKK